MSNEGPRRPRPDKFHGEEMPPANDQERRAIRQRYRELMDQTQVNELDQEKSLDSLTSTLAEADLIFERRPQMPREAALDSKLVSHLSNLGANIALSLDTNIVTFHPSEFTEQLANFVSPTEKTISNWSDFGKNISSFFRRAPPLTFMYGAFETDEPDASEKPKEKKAQLLKTTGEKQAPENVKEMGKSDKEVTTAEVDRILLLLRYLCKKRNGPLCFFEFAVHPESFAQTVLNIFHITFLIRDEYALVYLDENGFPVIEAITDETGGPNSNAPKPVKNEVALTMDKTQWKAIVEAFKIEHATIPPSRPLPGRAELQSGSGASHVGPSGSGRK